MEMKLVYSTLLILIMLSINGFGQSQRGSEEAILQSLNNPVMLIPGDNPPEDGNTGVINQFGYANVGLINQFQSAYGIGNYGNILQDGSYNAAILSEYGNNISANLSQLGQYNYAEVVLTGSNIGANITQDGFGNYINQNLSGSDFDYSVLQSGNNNALIHYQEGIYSTSFEISQVGDGISTIIVNGP